MKTLFAIGALRATLGVTLALAQADSQQGGQAAASGPTVPGFHGVIKPTSATPRKTGRRSRRRRRRRAHPIS
jgi:hypothetical protein